MGVVPLCAEDEESGDDDDSDEGVPGEWRAPAEAEKVVGVLSPNLASNSLRTAELGLAASGPTMATNPTAASDPLASS